MSNKYPQSKKCPFCNRVMRYAKSYKSEGYECHHCKKRNLNMPLRPNKSRYRSP